MDKAVLLLSQYCDNDLSPEDQAEFVLWLKSDPAHVSRFVRATQLHSLLYDLVQEQRLQSSAWSHTLHDSDPYIPLPNISQSQAEEKPSTKAITRNAWILSLAALFVGILTTIAISPAVKGPDLVAQVTNLQGAVTAANGQAILVGTFLSERETIKVNGGNVLVTFQSGAKLFVEGDSEFLVDGANSGSLLKGHASARVPTQAIGFSIHTSLLDIVDLGTEFQINILDEQQIDLHVFDGLVEVRLAESFSHAKDGPLRISEGRSARFDVRADEVMTLEYDESLKREF